MCLLLFMKCCGHKWSSFSVPCVFSTDYKWRLCSKELHLTDMKPCQNTHIHIYHTHTHKPICYCCFQWSGLCGSRNTCVESLQRCGSSGGHHSLSRINFSSTAFPHEPCQTAHAGHMLPSSAESAWWTQIDGISHLQCITMIFLFFFLLKVRFSDNVVNEK